jgi:hypothetical protein
VIIWLFFGWKPDLTGQYGLRLVEGDHLINLTRQADHGFVKSATEIQRKFRSHAGGFLRLNGNFPLSLPSLAQAGLASQRWLPRNRMAPRIAARAPYL